MLLFQTLKNPAILRLWIGQVFSSVGDEVYRVAFLWLAIGFIGHDTGYLAATQMLSLLIVCLFGGKWAEQWNPFRAMIGVDVIRAALMLVPFAYSLFHPLSLTVLWITGILAAGLSGFFDPALQGVLPLHSADRRTLQGANGLMSTTLRMARILAPIVIGALTALIPVIHFFTINAATFLISAFSVYLVWKMPILKKHERVVSEDHGVFKTMKVTFAAMKREPIAYRALVIKGLSGGAWSLGFSLGLALLVRERFAGNIQAFGWVMGGYGFGNVLSAFFFASRERRDPEKLMYFGHIWLGVGFLLIDAATSIPYLMLASAFTAIGGPMNDLPFTDLVQATYPLHEVPKIIRLRIAFETGCGLIGFAVAPLAFGVMTKGTVEAIVGILIVSFGVYGWRMCAPRDAQLAYKA